MMLTVDFIIIGQLNSANDVTTDSTIDESISPFFPNGVGTHTKAISIFFPTKFDISVL